MTELTRDEFLEQLHNALNHLYNADQLRRSSLAGLFGVAERFDTSLALRKILVDAIEDLKPAASEPDQSRSWRTYDSLYCCFIQQLNQQVVADQLCISPRQLRREQRNALEHLADRLWERYRLGTDGPHPAAEAASASSSPGENLMGELSWLMDSQPVQANRLEAEIRVALAVVQPLAQRLGVTLSSQAPEELPGLAIHPAALNQILVSLLGLAVGAAGGGFVTISVRVLVASVEIEILALAAPQVESSQSSSSAPEFAESLRIAAELARLSGGRLILSENAPSLEDQPNGSPVDPFPIRLVLPALEKFPVLVVDDIEDSLQLYRRYAAGTRYHLVCTRDTELVMNLVETVRPRIIVLDIMMPKENGWIVLGRLRQHPLTTETPVIICTILPQEGLALSLGANAFLKKPVSREMFLQALDQQFALLEPEYP